MLTVHLPAKWAESMESTCSCICVQMGDYMYHLLICVCGTHVLIERSQRSRQPRGDHSAVLVGNQVYSQLHSRRFSFLGIMFYI
jgi:hypothetical protein